jgi:hypothetical protein
MSIYSLINELTTIIIIKTAPPQPNNMSLPPLLLLTPHLCAVNRRSDDKQHRQLPSIQAHGRLLERARTDTDTACAGFQRGYTRKRARRLDAGLAELGLGRGGRSVGCWVGKWRVASIGVGGLGFAGWRPRCAHCTADGVEVVR